MEIYVRCNFRLHESSPYDKIYSVRWLIIHYVLQVWPNYSGGFVIVHTRFPEQHFFNCSLNNFDVNLTLKFVLGNEIS